MAIFDNFPYVNFQELNLDYLIKKMKELQEDWDRMVGNVRATAEVSSQVGVSVDGDLKNGLTFDFKLPPTTPATSSQAGIIQPDNETTKVASGILSAQSQGIVASLESGTNVLEADTFTLINLNARLATFGAPGLFSLTQGGVRVNQAGYYLIEGSSWVMCNDPTQDTTAQLRILTGTAYPGASVKGWGVLPTANNIPVNTAARIVQLNQGDIIFLDIAITGSDGLFKYTADETQLTILKVA